jgi:osmotically-inducible protein OsmY
MGIAATEFAEVIKFRFGAPVIASDGASGVLAHVIVDPAARTVSHVGVRLNRFAPLAHSIPTALVKDARAESLELTIARAEIPAKAQAMPEGFVRVSSSTVVNANDKRLGRLAQLSADRDTLALRRLVVDRGLGRGEVLVPVDMTTVVGGRRIDVQLEPAQVNGLIVYRPDADLLQEINQALYDYPRLRVDLRGMQARVVDGEVWLKGHISSDLNSRLAEDQLKGISGLAAVHNQLVSDPDLAAAVAASLARDPRTRGQHIGVYPALGEVRLRGAVATSEARAAAAQVAAAVPGAERVVNELAVRPDADVVPVFAGVTGQDDLVPGGA